MLRYWRGRYSKFFLHQREGLKQWLIVLGEGPAIKIKYSAPSIHQSIQQPYTFPSWMINEFTAAVPHVQTLSCVQRQQLKTTQLLHFFIRTGFIWAAKQWEREIQSSCMKPRTVWFSKTWRQNIKPEAQITNLKTGTIQLWARINYSRAQMIQSREWIRFFFSDISQTQKKQYMSEKIILGSISLECPLSEISVQQFALCATKIDMQTILLFADSIFALF